MSVPLNAIAPPTLELEWERVELLAQCLLSSQRGAEPAGEQIERLQQLQARLERLRNSEQSPWRRLPVEDLPPLALDLLAAVYAAETRPRVGWIYQELQSGSAQTFATPALLSLLLAFDDSELASLRGLIAADGALVARKLVAVESNSAFSPLRPEPAMLARLMDWPLPEQTPPGAVRVRQRADWDELVLPTDRARMLREFLLWLRHRERVVDEWGGRPVGGPVALFSGPSGTGKTFAAIVLATELGWPLFRVDLARLVSKYIGETEKNLGRLFDAAHGQPMVLQFDEVDALMSKRGEIKEARDRYANMEVSYLLARIEEHQGPCILTTNLRSQIDKAFSRRFQMVVEFPRPDAQARAELWRRMLPQRAPLADDLDIPFLARAVNLTGGNIRNAGLHAAYLAAGDRRAIDMSHIAIAVWRELAKDRVQLNPSDLGPLAAHLPEALL
ncbi:MAG: ATP-binding protein [Gammaproteobacteria bacterium]|nr:ATP-binding protein [Gammaproteobacteria bacterium]